LDLVRATSRSKSHVHKQADYHDHLTNLTEAGLPTTPDQATNTLDILNANFVVQREHQILVLKVVHHREILQASATEKAVLVISEVYLVALDTSVSEFRSKTFEVPFNNHRAKPR